MSQLADVLRVGDPRPYSALGVSTNVGWEGRLQVLSDRLERCSSVTFLLPLEHLLPFPAASKMKVSSIIVLFAGLVSALAVERRQFGTSTTSNELTSGSCKPVIFIFARGSTEIGNMVSSANADR
jgi:hypothetical protein